MAVRVGDIIQGHANDGQTAATFLFAAGEILQLAQATRAPSGPKVEQHHLSVEIRQVDHMPVQSGGFEVRHGCRFQPNALGCGVGLKQSRAELSTMLCPPYPGAIRSGFSFALAALAKVSQATLLTVARR